MSHAPLTNQFETPPSFRWTPSRPRHENAFPLAPDRAEVEECRRLLGSGPVAAMVAEIESYGCTDAEALGALRDLAEWGTNPFEEVG